MTDRNEAFRLADEVRAVANRLQYTPGGFYGVETVGPLNQAATLLRQLVKEVDAKQAKIDALMLEYCPEEMTQEQIDNWASHQRVVKVGEI